MQTVLFLCTGNYYRSRFSEIYFNWHAPSRGLPWRAVSRGLALDPANVGPISRNTLKRLELLQIPWPVEPRFPLDVAAEDLAGAALVIALKESEHRPLLERRFPHWVARTEYWQIDDVDCALPDQALPLLERRLDALLERLARAGNAA
jgi:protein-tyrosine phosphatase